MFSNKHSTQYFNIDPFRSHICLCMVIKSNSNYVTFFFKHEFVYMSHQPCLWTHKSFLRLQLQSVQGLVPERRTNACLQTKINWSWGLKCSWKWFPGPSEKAPSKTKVLLQCFFRRRIHGIYCPAFQLINLVYCSHLKGQINMASYIVNSVMPLI